MVVFSSPKSTLGNEMGQLKVIQHKIRLGRLDNRLRAWYRVKKPIIKVYQRILYKFADREHKNLLKIFNSPKLQAKLSNNYNDEYYHVYLDENDFTPEVARILYPMGRYMRTMVNKQRDILAVLGAYSFKAGTEFITADSIKRSEEQRLALGPDRIVKELLEAHSYPACENTVKGYSGSMEILLKRGLAEGKTTAQLSSDLRLYFSMATEPGPKYIYDRIARNETARFTNEGKMYSWNELGVELYDWLQGPGPCVDSLICLDMADGSPYEVGNGPMPIDDTHINCLCDIVPHVEQDFPWIDMSNLPELPTGTDESAFLPSEIEDTVSSIPGQEVTPEQTVKTGGQINRIEKERSPWYKSGKVVGPYTAWMSEDPKDLINEANILFKKIGVGTVV